jgi:hypothetical protein
LRFLLSIPHTHARSLYDYDFDLRTPHAHANHPAAQGFLLDRVRLRAHKLTILLRSKGCLGARDSGPGPNKVRGGGDEYFFLVLCSSKFEIRFFVVRVESYKMSLSASPKRKRNMDSSAPDSNVLGADVTKEATFLVDSPETLGETAKVLDEPTPVNVPGFEDVYLSPSPSQARKIAVSRIRMHLAKKSSEVNSKDSVHANEVYF